MDTDEPPTPSSSTRDYAKRPLSSGRCPVTKRPRTDDNPLERPVTLSKQHELSGSLTPLSVWTDDILIHLLQFLDLYTLESFEITCKRVHFFVRRNLKVLIPALIPRSRTFRQIQHLLASRSEVIDCPSKDSFAYIHALSIYYKHFLRISTMANPVDKCPRALMHPDVHFEWFHPSAIHLFRSNHCYYFARPFEHVVDFWTIFWEYKRMKKIEPLRY